MKGIRVTNMTDEEKRRLASMMADEHMDEFIKRVHEAVATMISDTIHIGCTYEVTVPVTLKIRGEKLIRMIEHVKGVYVSFD
jgi:hypothetical protein